MSRRNSKKNDSHRERERRKKREKRKKKRCGCRENAQDFEDYYDDQDLPLACFTSNVFPRFILEDGCSLPEDIEDLIYHFI